MEISPESFTFTVGKLDAGMAILLGERAHLIEFPSILLPPGASTGSIVNISVTQNVAEEKKRDVDFWALQKQIVEEFGVRTPEPPQLELRNVTQTSVTLEWPPLKLATAKLRSLDIYKNHQRLASIPSPLTNTSTKLSGLEIDCEYSFQLIQRTTAGIFPSNLIRVRTHTMTDTSGISVCFGTVEDEELFESAKEALEEMRAKWSDKVQIDTTHFVCTSPASKPSAGGLAGAPGVEYKRALQHSIPVVHPNWILACLQEKKMVPIAPFYLNAKPPPVVHRQSLSQVQVGGAQRGSPPTTPSSQKSDQRASMPTPSRSSIATPPGNSSAFVNQPTPSTMGKMAHIEPTPENPALEEEQDIGARVEDPNVATSKEAKRKSRSGTMNRDFKFPPSPTMTRRDGVEAGGAGSTTAGVVAEVARSSVEVPAPPPVEKEKSGQVVEEGDDDVGPTVEISLN